MTLAHQLAAYTDWRTRLAAEVGAFRRWLVASDLSDAAGDQRLEQLLERLREDRLNVAFVAEFSRGKSELINAIFFSGYGQRILPSAAGRTTMCPTELAWDAARPPSIELLPIQTRAGTAGVSEYRGYPDEWRVLPLVVDSTAAMQAALQHVSETLRVAPDEARRLGFTVSQVVGEGYPVGADGLVEVPRWRHALINFPHPLLKQGLVILDTPGLNAIGAEPELTLSLLPSAHVILFILAADAGVTQSDLTVWKEHIGGSGGARRGRLVVLNKIDGQWDELKTPAAIDAEIARQVAASAATLAVPVRQVFPVSAQKGLVAKITGDAALLARSRLPALEAALSDELIPAKREIVRDDSAGDFGEVSRRARDLLAARVAALHEQLGELTELRGKNRGVVDYMMGKVRADKREFEAGLQRYYAVRSVFSTLGNKLFAHLGSAALRDLSAETRAAMHAASFSRHLSAAMAGFFAQARQALASSGGAIGEINNMMAAVYRQFAVEHGLRLGTPAAFSLLRHEKELARLEAWCNTHLNTPRSLLTADKTRIANRFFAEVAVHVQRTFARANQDAEAWLRAIMAPLESQIREHQIQLKRRLESIKRIHQATDTLEERIGELASAERSLQQQVAELEQLVGRVEALLAPPGGALRAA